MGIIEQQGYLQFYIVTILELVYLTDFNPNWF